MGDDEGLFTLPHQRVCKTIGTEQVRLEVNIKSDISEINKFTLTTPVIFITITNSFFHDTTLKIMHNRLSN